MAARRSCDRDLLWKKYFRDPLQWFHNRNAQVTSSRCPERHHANTMEELWIDGFNPLWVSKELMRRKGAGFRSCRDWGEETDGINDVRTYNNVDITAFALLKACAKKKDLRQGISVHADILKEGLLAKNSYLGSALISMYAKCGALAKAQEVLDELPVRDAVSWNSVIAGYAQQGCAKDAFNCFEQMKKEGLSPNAVTFICILKVCGSSGVVDKGVEIHSEIINKGLLRHVEVGNAVVDMYAKCGALRKAHQVLNGLLVRNVVSWNALISGYIKNGQDEEALYCFKQMQREGFFPDAITFTCILKACARTGSLDKGMKIHEEIVNKGLLAKDTMVGTALMDMYTKLGELEKAQRLFDELPFRDIVTWSALISGYAEHGQGEEALNCYEHMQRAGLSPNEITLSCVLKACGITGSLEKGKKIHDEIMTKGLLKTNIALGNALVDMYARCGALEKAKQVFEDLLMRDVVSWSALITGYSQQGQCVEALNCFEQMEREGLVPSAITFIGVLKACGSVGEKIKGKHLHNEIVNKGLLKNNIELGNALVDMYAKFGDIWKAQQVFDEVVDKNVVCWNALIAGYVHLEKVEEAFKCCEDMQHDGFSPDSVTFVCLLKACGIIGALDKGKQIHDEIVGKALVVKDTVLGTALVDMYVKCGELGKAQEMFDELSIRDVVTWNSLISGYTQQGRGEEALNCFRRMQCDNISPDAVTFLCVLTACSHSGLVDEGLIHLRSMSKKYGLEPVIEHYTCMLDLLGRAGHLDKAIIMMKEMPPSDYPVWSALLAACEKWGNVKLGKLAFEQAVALDNMNSRSYVYMANIYAAAGMLEEKEKVEAMRLRISM